MLLLAVCVHCFWVRGCGAPGGVGVQDGMLKNKGTYEIMAPEDVGIFRSDPAGLVLGKHRYATTQ